MTRYYRSMGDSTPAPPSHTDDLLEPSFVSDHPADKPKPRTHRRPMPASATPDPRMPTMDRAAGPLPPGAMPVQPRPMGPVQSPPPPRPGRVPAPVHDRRPAHDAALIDGIPHHHLSPLLIGGVVVLGLGAIAFLLGSARGSRARG